MAIAVAENPTAVAEATTCVVNLSAATEGHTLVATCGVRLFDNLSISGSGWTRVVDVRDAVNLVSFSCWYKVAGAGEPTGITFTGVDASEKIGCVARLTGAHATTPYVNDSDGTSGTDDSPTPGTAGGSGADHLLAAIFTRAGAITLDGAGGYTQIAEQAGTNAMFWLLEKVSTAAETPTMTLGGATTWAAFNVAFDAAVGTLLFRRRQMEMA